MNAFVRTWALNRIQKDEQQVEVPSSAEFDEKTLVVDGGTITVRGGWLSQQLNATGFYLSLPEYLHAVLIHPDGSLHGLPGGLTVAPPGLYRLKYVAKQVRVLALPQVSNVTRDGAKLSLRVLIEYRVQDPSAVLSIENPITTLLEYVRSDLSDYIRSHDYDDLLESELRLKSIHLAAFVNQQHSKRRLLAKAIDITHLEVTETIGDASIIELRRSISMKQLSAQTELRSQNVELEKRVAQYEAEIRMMQAKHQAELEKVLAALDQEKARAAANQRNEEVSFTAYHPKEGNVTSWHTLLVYTHVQTALQQVQEDARRFADQLPSPKETTSRSSTPIARGTELTIIPSCEGITFNPERLSFTWVEDLNRADFRFKAHETLLGDAAKGQISIYAGPLIIGTLKFAMLFTDQSPSPVQEHEEHASMYGRDDVFISYSRQDTEIARIFKTILAATGMDVFIDVDNLKPGQLWQKELQRRIERARVFQMFWSENYSRSENCRMEWEHAVKQNRGEGYIRPVFWQKPLAPPPPDTLSKYNFQYIEM